VLESYTLETMAESQGPEEVQEALHVREALAAGTFTWTPESAGALKLRAGAAAADEDSILCAETLCLDDCHQSIPSEAGQNWCFNVTFLFQRSFCFALLLPL